MSASTNEYEFTPTQDWFTHNIPSWKSLFPIDTSPKPRILEIGFLLSTPLCAQGSEIVCIDHFDLMHTPAGRERHRKLSQNLPPTGRSFRILPQYSVPALYALLEEEIARDTSAGFDWVYVDRSHRADDTLLDAELAWRLARKGCIFIFDDCNWPEQFIEREYEHLSKTAEQYQMILRRTSEMRIGFLVEQSAKQHFPNALGLGIYLVLAIDTSYAMAAAVTIRSAIEKTTGRMTIYIVDCVFICAEDKEKIKSSLPKRHDATLILPVERALYLDANMLVCRSLEDMDVEFPMGHGGVSRRRYFNAGVLLIDLAKARMHLSELAARVREMKDARYCDLGDWTEVNLSWNAQGLGTYAGISSADRDILALGDMKDPGVVHFTGPVHPSLVAPAWAGWQGSTRYHEMCEGEKQKAIQDSIKKFETRVQF
ncbi:glycosyltransferase family 8 protein [Suillus fuscotomentosus]|uniref:Glycosyltransferase family 8 protein n=1 Tax=Suillus fuscotomentosus TaxID=1912939 RepID=A0AAD4HJ53_9AGAM|nr:glycosyltransferase family 8 protein [Suillus fuscotomentosus]KAG1898437.1 glycosyltransferase family 8 protein [Suillus fuscotomentosus]